MIGVIADSADHGIVREFFELFKTPWEFYRRDRRYAVLLCAGDGPFDHGAKIVLCYSGRETPCDDSKSQRNGRRHEHTYVLSRDGNRIPIYGEIVTFPQKSDGLLTEEVSQRAAAYIERFGERVLVRIGYDLFGEVGTLLATGQPPVNASIPALDLHIAILRDLILGCRVPLAEIPPVPQGYRFIACLTHDVDHPSIRRHKWDHTTFGFLYRATVGSLRDLMRGRIQLRGLLRNWAAALKLPLVHLGLAEDFWGCFEDRYSELENGLPCTCFVIPFEGRPGRNSQGPAPKFRAARYGARDIAKSIEKLVTAGCEVGLHGIDAWLDESKGSEELAEIRRLTGMSEIGVRMHWLYYDEQSPATLEKAGAAYDSTIGYNQTVGYRAGTTQVYKPLKADRLLELPLHVMDTALFYPAYLGLSSREASTLLGRMVDHAVQFGGCLTVNWHDRSTAPERLWDSCYRDLVEELKAQGAWFATARQAVAWFQKRRSAVFEADGVEPEAVCARTPGNVGQELPGLRLRVYKMRYHALRPMVQKTTPIWPSLQVLAPEPPAEPTDEQSRRRFIASLENGSSSSQASRYVTRDSWDHRLR